jgi:hypothetical protein
MKDEASRTGADEILRTLHQVVPPLVREMQQFERSYVLPAVREMRRLDRAVVLPIVREMEKLLAPLALRIQQSVMPALSETFKVWQNTVTPEFVREMQNWADAIERARIWVEKAPDALRAALESAAVIPHPELSLSDLQSVLATYESNGGPAAVARLDELHRALLTDPRFRRLLEARWAESERSPVLREILAAHDANLFAVAIPAAIAQAEGVIATAIVRRFGMPKKVRHDELRSHIREAAHFFFAPVVGGFSAKLFTAFKHGDSDSGELERHRVLHGGSWSYGSLDNSVRAIVWLDYVLVNSNVDVAVREPELTCEPEASDS